MAGIFGGINIGGVSLVSGHRDADLWHVSICTLWASLIYPSFAGISAMVSGRYSFRLVVQVFVP